MVATHGECIAVRVSAGGVDVVQARVAESRGRRILIQPGGGFADAAAGTRVALKLLDSVRSGVVGEDVENRLQPLKSPVQHLLGRDPRLNGRRLPDPQAFIIDEEECLVFTNWPAERAAELILLEGRRS